MRSKRNPWARWLLRKDLDRVLEISEEAFPDSWSEAELIQQLRRKECIATVAEENDEVLGFAIYMLHPSRIELLRLAVCEKYRRSGVGSFLIAKIAGKLAPTRRNRVEIVVRESNLTAQLFLRNQGFRAETILKHVWVQGEHSYLMVKRNKVEGGY